jgi:hypothetical protein
MSTCTAKLCVWVTAFGDPCHIMEAEPFYVHVTDCQGHVLTWCKKTYSFIPTKCGMVEIEVPPGCYSVFATHTAPAPHISRPPFGNRLTHIQVVRVNCGDNVCVTLFSPTLSHCGTWFAGAIQAQIPGVLQEHRELATAAVKAIEALLAKIGTDPYTANTRPLLAEPPK